MTVTTYDKAETYLVCRVGRGIKPGNVWRIVAPKGNTLGTFKSKAEATRIARVLAGWRGKVVVG